MRSLLTDPVNHICGVAWLLKRSGARLSAVCMTARRARRGVRRGAVWAKSQLPDLRAADTTRRTGTPTPFKALLGSKPEPLIHLAEEKENYNV